MFLLRFVRVYQTTEHNIAKQCHLKIYCHENLKKSQPNFEKWLIVQKVMNLAYHTDNTAVYQFYIILFKILFLFKTTQQNTTYSSLLLT